MTRPDAFQEVDQKSKVTSQKPKYLPPVLISHRATLLRRRRGENSSRGLLAGLAGLNLPQSPAPAACAARSKINEK